MPFIEVSPIQLPGEPSIVAIAGLFRSIIEKSDPARVDELTRRLLELLEPYHQLNVGINRNLAAFLARVLHVDVKDVKLADPEPPK